MSKPYQICNPRQFNLIGNGLNFRKNAYWKVCNPLNFSGLQLVPVGSIENPFTGTFNGNNKMIFNYNYAADPTGRGSVALFISVNNAMLTNLILKPMPITYSTIQISRKRAALAIEVNNSIITNIVGILQNIHAVDYSGGLIFNMVNSVVRNVIIQSTLTVGFGLDGFGLLASRINLCSITTVNIIGEGNVSRSILGDLYGISGIGVVSGIAMRSNISSVNIFFPFALGPTPSYFLPINVGIVVGKSTGNNFRYINVINSPLSFGNLIITNIFGTYPYPYLGIITGETISTTFNNLLIV